MWNVLNWDLKQYQTTDHADYPEGVSGPDVIRAGHKGVSQQIQDMNKLLSLVLKKDTELLLEAGHPI